MNAFTDVPPPDPDLDPNPDIDPEPQLQRDVYLVATEALRDAMPPPAIDTPETRLVHHRAALTAVAGLIPGNAAEADLAACHVIAMAHVRSCQRRAAEAVAAGDAKREQQLHAQAASMGREARGFLGKLMAMQAIRRKRDAKDETRDAAASTRRCVLGLMVEALDSLPPPPPPPPPAPEAPAPAATFKAPPPVPYDEWTEEEKRIDRLRSVAGRYAVINPLRVKRIRQLGGLPPDCDYEPPPPDVLEEIIHGDSSNLRWADTYEPYVAPA